MITTDSKIWQRALGGALAAAVLAAPLTTLAPSAGAATTATEHRRSAGLVAAQQTALAASQVGVLSGSASTALVGAKRKAKVSGTYTRLSSGKVRVAVRTNAKKVKVSYRTTKNGTRSVKATVRHGVARTTLAVGAKRIRAQALATRALRSSATQSLTPSWYRIDIDGDGVRDWAYDGNQDGRYELFLWDDDRSSRFEEVAIVTASANGIFYDKNEDGYFESAAIDANKDGYPDRMFHDGDGDGYAELECVDRIGNDGRADTWVYTQVTPSSSADRVARDVMTSNIVTMNQLRQLDPWSTGYISYDASPWILR